MLLEYVVRTMEDDFIAKLSSAALKQSIARGVLSCNCQFTKVRYVKLLGITGGKWLQVGMNVMSWVRCMLYVMGSRNMKMILVEMLSLPDK